MILEFLYHAEALTYINQIKFLKLQDNPKF